jgi:hypothetical protein
MHTICGIQGKTMQLTTGGGSGFTWCYSIRTFPRLLQAHPVAGMETVIYVGCTSFQAAESVCLFQIVCLKLSLQVRQPPVRFWHGKFKFNICACGAKEQTIANPDIVVMWHAENLLNSQLDCCWYAKKCKFCNVDHSSNIFDSSTCVSVIF